MDWLIFTCIIFCISSQISEERSAELIGKKETGRKLKCKNPTGLVGNSFTKSCKKSTCTNVKGKMIWKRKFDADCCKHNGKGFAKNTTIARKKMSSGCDWSILRCVGKKGKPIIEVQEYSNCTSTTKCSCPTSTDCKHTTINEAFKLTSTKMQNAVPSTFSTSILQPVSTKNIRRSTTFASAETTYVKNLKLTPNKMATETTEKQPTTAVLSKVLSAKTSLNITEAYRTTKHFTSVKITNKIITAMKATMNSIPILNQQPAKTSSFSNISGQSTVPVAVKESILPTSTDESFLTTGTFGPEVSLMGSSKDSEGNVFIGNLPVCDDDWDLVDANVTCRMLGFPGAIRRTFGSEFGNVPEHFLMSHVNCTGLEDSLLECPHKDGKDCGSCMAAGVVCQDYKIELRGGSEVHIGNVFFGNRPVCDKSWDLHDAGVACKMLGFHGADQSTESSKFGSVPENFMMADVGCNGNESSIQNCSHTDGADCNANDGAGVICLDTIGYMISLKDGKAAHRGHVFVGNFPVCSDGWDLRDSNVACRMLGYAGAEESFEHDLDCDRESNSHMLTGFGCSGIEHSLRNCPHIVNDTCEGGRAGVVCFPGDSTLNISLSFNEKAKPHGSGKGNVFFNNQPVCDDSWDDNDAKVVCKMLGYSGGTATIRSSYGKVSENFIMDNVQCYGNETTLYDCPQHNGKGECEGHEGAGVECSSSDVPAMRLDGGTATPGAGSGNVFFGNSPVCGTGWNMKIANLTCKMLGYAGATKISAKSLFGEVPTTSMVYDIQCRGDEWSLAACSYKEDGNCSATVGKPKGAGVVCQGYTVELRGGSNAREGDVYLFDLPVSDYGWGITDAEVVCRMLGFNGVEKSTTGSTFESVPSHHQYKGHNVQCSGDETNLGDCPHVLDYQGWNGNRGAGVVCLY